MTDNQDPQNKQPMSEPASHSFHTAAERTVSPVLLRWKECPMQIGFSALAPGESVHTTIVLFCSFISRR